MMMRFPLTAVLLLAAATSGCGLSKQVEERSNKNQVFVFGYLDMDEAPVSLDWFSISEVKPKRQWHSFRISDGAFYNEWMEPGSYRFSSFGGQNCLLIFCGDPYRFSFPTQGDGFHIKRPGSVHFLGSFKYVHIDRGFFRADEFTLKKVKQPTELEVLRKILKHTDGTSWKATLEARIRKLS